MSIKKAGGYFDLTDEQRQALGEYILLQAKGGRPALQMDELKTVIETIKICIPE